MVGIAPNTNGVLATPYEDRFLRCEVTFIGCMVGIAHNTNGVLATPCEVSCYCLTSEV